MSVTRSLLGFALLVFGAVPVQAQLNVVDVDVTFPATVGNGNDLTVTFPAGVGYPALLFFAPTASLNLTNEVYASDLGAQLSLFTSHGVAVIQPDLTATWPEVPIQSPTDFTVFVAGFVAPNILASNLGEITLFPPCSGTPDHFQESNGLVIAEIESAEIQPGSLWAVESALPGFTGDAYYRWTGANQFNNMGIGILTYPIEIHTPGTYRIKIHNRHNNPSSDLENDCWMRVDGGNWEKFASNAGITNAWNWAGGFESGQADFFLGAGTHTIQLSARSQGYHMDRILAYLPGVAPDPFNLSNPESCRP